MIGSFLCAITQVFYDALISFRKDAFIFYNDYTKAT